VDPTQAVSNYVTTPTPLNSTSYLVIFASDPSGDPGAVLGLTPIAGAPSTSGDGGVQDAFTLSGQTELQTQSGFSRTWNPVPEPGTIVLFGSGVACVIGLARRKILTLV
jgi:PEP-CTERM motif